MKLLLLYLSLLQPTTLHQRNQAVAAAAAVAVAVAAAVDG